jgi:hypothetical protein
MCTLACSLRVHAVVAGHRVEVVADDLSGMSNCVDSDARRLANDCLMQHDHSKVDKQLF